MKTQNEIPANNTAQQNPLAWLKRSGYNQKPVRTINYLTYRDLMWVKVNGFKQNQTSTTATEDQFQMQSAEPIRITVYDHIQQLKAQHDYYFNAMTMLVILNMICLFTLFTHLKT